jgi:hypothetical protein
MADGSLAVEPKKSPSAAPVATKLSQKARKPVPRIPRRQGRRHGPNTVYAEGYIHTGAVIPQLEISKMLERLDRAFCTARRIDARQRKLEGSRDGRRSPTFRLAGVIKGIYNTLDKVHGNGEYVHDIRLAHVQVTRGGTVYRLNAPAKIASQAAAGASKVAAPAVLKPEVAHV